MRKPILLLFGMAILITASSAHAQVASPSFNPNFNDLNPALAGFNQEFSFPIKVSAHYDTLEWPAPHRYAQTSMQFEYNEGWVLLLGHEGADPEKIRQGLTRYAFGYGWERLKIVGYTENFQRNDLWTSYSGYGWQLQPLEWLHLGAVGKRAEAGEHMAAGGIGIIINDFFRFEGSTFSVNDGTTKSTGSNNTYEVNLSWAVFSNSYGYAALIGHPLPVEMDKYTFSFDASWIPIFTGGKNSYDKPSCFISSYQFFHQPTYTKGQEIGCGGMF